MTKRKITIALIDDHEIVRNGIKELLENLGNYEVIDEFHSGLSFLAKLPKLKKFPDLFILDYSMPLLNGIEVLKRTIETHKDLKFLLLTQHLEEDVINQAYKEGARGFLHKTCSSDELKHSIDCIVAFGYANISDILKRIRNEPSPPEASSSFDITENELILLEWICDEQEYTYKEIADKMRIPEKRVDFYRGCLFNKLKVKSKVGLVLQSFRHKLTKPFLIDPSQKVH